MPASDLAATKINGEYIHRTHFAGLNTEKSFRLVERLPKEPVLYRSTQEILASQREKQMAVLLAGGQLKKHHRDRDLPEFIPTKTHLQRQKRLAKSISGARVSQTAKYIILTE